MARKATLLVLEPYRDVGETIAELLRSAGYRVFVATSLAEGGRRAGSVAIDALVVASDFDAEWSRLPANLEGVPTVKTVASAVPEDGGNWIAKPFSLQQLTQLLAVVLDVSPRS